MGGFARDVRQACRQLARSWPFTIVAVATLALGIGVNATTFAVADAVLFRDLPFRDPSRLVIAGETRAGLSSRAEVSHANFLDWQTRAAGFDGLAAMTFSNWTFTLGGAEPQAVDYRPVSATFFDVLGVQAAMGRTFTPEDDRRGAARVVVIGDGLWRRMFASDPSVLGRAVTIDGRPFTIVGVMPAWFRYPAGAEAWAPVAPALADPRTDNLSTFLENRDAAVLHVLGRLRPGVPLEAARAELQAISGELGRTYGRREPATLVMTPLAETIVGAVAPAMRALMAAVMLLLLVAAANVAGLMLMQVTSRRRELATHLALGESRRRLAWRLLVECGLLALVSAVAALMAARAALPLVVRLAPADLPRLADVAVDGRILLFTLAAAGVVAVACWLLPALSLRDTAIDQVLRATPRGSSDGGGRLRRLLVGAQVATAVVLIAFAGLLVQSVRRLERQDLGFDPRGLLTVEIPGRAGLTPGEANRLRGAARDAAAAVPGVQSASLVYAHPLKALTGLDSSWRRDGQTTEAARQNPYVSIETISPGYFATLRTPLRDGRAFTDADTATSAPVAIVTERFARLAWPDRPAVGQPLWTAATGGQKAPPLTVVGVVADARARELRIPVLEVYIPVAQSRFAAADLVVRAGGDVRSVAAGIRAVLQAQHPAAAIDVISLEDAVARHQAPWRSNLAFIGLFAALTLSLAAIGVYAMLAAAVAARTREIGVRMALGASPRRMLRAVVGEGGRVALAGIVVGLAAAVALGRFIESMLFDVTALDLPSLLTAAAMLLGVGVLAAIVPAWRAARVDPAVSLRAE